jgi:hypothetical protein
MAAPESSALERAAALDADFAMRDASPVALIKYDATSHALRAEYLALRLIGNPCPSHAHPLE